MKVFIVYPLGEDVAVHDLVHAAARVAKGSKYTVVNSPPKRQARPERPPRALISELLQAEAILLIPGWESDPVARYLAATATELGLEILGTFTHDQELVPLVHSRCGVDSWKGPKALFTWHMTIHAHDVRPPLPPRRRVGDPPPPPRGGEPRAQSV